jgi:isoleucyl-tRNA synthetase
VPTETAALLGDAELAELCITSSGSVIPALPPAGAFVLPDLPGIGVVVRDAEGDKCARCWRVLPEVGEVPGHADLCRRCAGVVSEMADAAG